MPQVARLATIPLALRSELDQRLKSDAFGNLEETAAWLREQGVDIQKSALGVYSRRLKLARELDLGESLGLNDIGVVKLRLQCAEIAAVAAGGDDDLFVVADQLLAWAVEPLVER